MISLNDIVIVILDIVILINIFFVQLTVGKNITKWQNIAEYIYENNAVKKLYEEGIFKALNL